MVEHLNLDIEGGEGGKRCLITTSAVSKEEFTTRADAFKIFRARLETAEKNFYGNAVFWGAFFGVGGYFIYRGVTHGDVVLINSGVSLCAIGLVGAVDMGHNCRANLGDSKELLSLLEDKLLDVPVEKRAFKE